jgi:hypothetical protein
MKKLILSVAALGTMSLSGFAQGITFSDFENAAGYGTTIAGAPNLTQDLNLELLYGTSAGNVTTPVVTLLLSSSATPADGNNVNVPLGETFTGAGDISAAGGLLYDTTGSSYAVPAGSVFFEVLAWSGNYGSYAAAEASGVTGVFGGASAVFPGSSPAAPATPNDIDGVGVINLTQVPTTVVPEPSTLAMAGVGLVSMLLMRRKVS